MLGLLRQRRWIGFTLLAVMFTLLFARLGIWQLDRLSERKSRNAITEANLAAAPAPFVDLVESAPTATESLAWRTLEVTGRWDVSHQILWRNRPLSGANGYEVITPLIPASGPTLLIDRGWVAAGASATAPENVPAPQSGLVTVNGWLRVSQDERPSDGLPAGQFLSINPKSLAKTMPYPLYDGYAILYAESPLPATAPTLLKAPDVTDGPHLSYAVQWFLFALVAVGGWYVFLKREEEEAEAGLTAGGPLPAIDPAADR